jgi:hypothetical protein
MKTHLEKQCSLKINLKRMIDKSKKEPILNRKKLEIKLRINKSKTKLRVDKKLPVNMQLQRSQTRLKITVSATEETALKETNLRNKKLKDH